MTTIVYDHKNKQVACDSRETADGLLVTDEARKYYKRTEVTWFICGTKADADIFIDNFEHNTESPANLECSGLFVEGGVVYKACIADGVYKKDLLPSNEGLGSGGWTALAAVDLGKTAKEAVEFAMIRDIYSGGKIHVYNKKPLNCGLFYRLSKL
jgi:hypothetical protein